MPPVALGCSLNSVVDPKQESDFFSGLEVAHLKIGHLNQIG